MKSLREMILANCKTRFDVDGVYYLEKHISQNITKLESQSVKVYGPSSSNTNWNVQPGLHDTHSALLVCIEEIKKPVTKEEIIKCLLDRNHFTPGHQARMSDLADRIASHGIQGE